MRLQSVSARGFTLIEMLLVMALIGMLLGMVSLASVPSRQAVLRRDAERLQSLFELAAEEAETRARPMAWQADEKGYRFFEQESGGHWVALDGDDLFKPRNWEAGAVHPSIQGAVTRDAFGLHEELTGVHLEFPRDGGQPPFVLELADASDGKEDVSADMKVTVQGGGGHYNVGDGSGNLTANFTLGTTR